MADSELNMLYKTLALFSFGTQLFGIFVPIFLLERGLDLTTAALFYLVIYFFFALLSWPSLIVGQKIGLKRLIIARFPLELLFILFLIKFDPNLLYMFAFLYALGNATFWIGINLDFFISSHKKKRYTESAILASIGSLAGAFAPLIGALILTNYGFTSLMFLAFILVGISAYPLLFSKERKVKIKSAQTKKAFDFNALFFLEGFTYIIEYLFWPVWIYLNDSIIGAGLAATLFALGISGFRILVGRLADKIGFKKILLAGAFFYILVWIARAMTTDPILMFALSLGGGLSCACIYNCTYGAYINSTPRKYAASSVGWREVSLNLGRSLMLVIVFLLPGEFPLYFLFSAVASFVILGIISGF